MTDSGPAVVRPWRRFVSVLLVICVGLASVETLWGELPARDLSPEKLPAAPVDAAAAAESAGSDHPDDCPCLCACACAGAQRLVLTVPPVALATGLTASPVAPYEERAPPPVDLPRNLRPPRVS